EDLLGYAESILKDLTSNTDKEHLIDVISGNAGAIPALLDMHELLGESSLIDIAFKLGDELLSLAVKLPIGWSWNSNMAGMESAHNLSGFSPGAGGAGFGLLELFN